MIFSQNKAIDFATIKQDFPIFSAQVNKDLVYLDSGATTQKPQAVIDAETQFYCQDNANVHRGVYALSERATAAYEGARNRVADFINAEHTHEIIFTRGTTEAINLVANSYGLSHLMPGDEIIVSMMEHHSNIVPWQIACEKTGALLRVIPITDEGELDLDSYKKLLNDRTKLVAIIHVSNVLGTINPIKKIIDLAHDNNTPVLIDGAQAVARLPVDVQALDCDFYTFSSHKLYGPTGVGVLYGKTKWLDNMPPYQSGGDMISRVTFEKTDFNVLPYKFEAGTPNIAGVVALSAAIDYVDTIGLDVIMAHEIKLLQLATEQLSQFEGLKIYGKAKQKIGVISFDFACAHPHDIATILDQQGVAVRAGHHCAMPLTDYYGVSALSRVSFGVYNQPKDIEHLVLGLQQVNQLFGS